MCQNFDYSALYARFYAQAEVRAAVGGMLATTRGGSGLELCRDTCSVPTGTHASFGHKDAWQAAVTHMSNTLWIRSRNVGFMT